MAAGCVDMQSRCRVAGQGFGWNDVEAPGRRSLPFIGDKSLKSAQLAMTCGHGREADQQKLLGRGANPEDGIGGCSIRGSRRSPDDEQRDGYDGFQDAFHFGFQADAAGRLFLTNLVYKEPP